jgi:hypothetical protein
MKHWRHDSMAIAIIEIGVLRELVGLVSERFEMGMIFWEGFY